MCFSCPRGGLIRLQVEMSLYPLPHLLTSFGRSTLDVYHSVSPAVRNHEYMASPDFPEHVI